MDDSSEHWIVDLDDNENHHLDVGTFSFGVTVAFTLNYIIGTGFLTLPWGFNQTGNILGVATLGFMTFFAMTSALLLLEAMARAEAFATQGNNFGSFVGDFAVANYRSLQTNDSQEFSQRSLKASKSDKGNQMQKTADLLNENLKISTQKFEITELCKIFLGKQSVRIYTFLVSIYMYGTLWAYSAVFADSLATRLPIMTTVAGDITPNNASYKLYLLLFSMIVVPASMLELSEQVFVQVSLSICRVIMMLLMVSTIFLASWQKKNSFESNNFTAPASVSESIKNGINMKKLYLLLPMVAYACIFHHSIPSISQPVKHKEYLGWIFCSTLGICFVSYCVMSIVISTYFGDLTMISANLNWESYLGKINANGEIPLYARCISSFIVLLPALDVASAFPLNSITLGNSLMSSYYGSRIHVLGVDEFSRSKAVFRGLASIPPIFAASFVSDLGRVTDYAGVSGFAIAFIVPPLLALFSARLNLYHL
jgi:amino acid permease